MQRLLKQPQARASKTKTAMENAIFICVIANLIVSIAILVELHLKNRNQLSHRIETVETNAIDTVSAALSTEDLANQVMEQSNSESVTQGAEKGYEASEGIDSIAATCSALAAEHGLTTREGEVLIQLARGYNCRSIAEMLTISEATVKSHSLKVYRKLGVHSQQEVIALVQSR